MWVACGSLSLESIRVGMPRARLENREMRQLAPASRRSIQVAYRIYWQRTARRKLHLPVRLLRRLEVSPAVYLIKPSCDSIVWCELVRVIVPLQVR
jgi:hypothetical protein